MAFARNCVLLLLIVYSSIYLSVFGAETSSGDVFEINGIVPDIVPRSPPSICQVTYNQTDVNNPGEEKAVTDVLTQPDVLWGGSNDSLYTLVMIDPDAPSRENSTLSQIIHWLVVNIQGNNLDSGETIYDYLAPSPPQGTGLHRYIIFIYNQPSDLDVNQTSLITSPENPRALFSISRFTERYNLSDPIAGNFFVAQAIYGGGN